MIVCRSLSSLVVELNYCVDEPLDKISDTKNAFL